MAILSADKLKEAKAWLHDVFVWGGLASTPKRTTPIEQYRYMYGTNPDNFRLSDKQFREAAVVICDCIKNRFVETKRFLAFDKAIKTISRCHFIPDLTSNKGNTSEPPEVLCTFIAWFCAENKLVYNNKATSVEEMKQIKSTLIGSVLWDNYLFAKDRIPEDNPNKEIVGDTGNANNSNQNPTPAPQAATSGTATSTQVKQGGPAGHTLYRGNANGILTQGKLTGITNNGYVYWISGDFVNAGKTEPKLHVKPQGARSPLKVNYGSGQGYNDSILYFASEGAAKNFMGIADASKPNNVKSLRLKKIGEDKNGYVEVSTEFGNAYIKASKLHEEVEEDLENKEEDNTVSNEEVWEAYKKGFFSEY